MAFRTWVKLLGAVLGVAALAGAGQLGVAYGLGILRLTRVLDLAARDQWTAQLAWAAWFAATSAVLGALAGARLRDRLGGAGSVGTHLALAVTAGVGAAVVVPLTMQPARTARVAGLDPVLSIGWCAAFGALVGAFAAYAALTQVVARWNLSAVGLAVWVIALVSVAPSLAPVADVLPAVRLGVFDAGFLSPAVTQRTALFTMPALALLIGAAVGWTARRREMPTLTIALAGLPGPALLTLSYLIAGPGSGSDHYQVVPYWAAMTATGAGVLGSVLAAVVGRADAGAEDDAAASAGLRVPGQRPSPAGDDLAPSIAAPSAATLSAPSAPEPSASASWAAAASADVPSSDPLSTAPSGASAVPPMTTPGGRRSSAADAFTGRTGEWTARRSAVLGGSAQHDDEVPAGRPPQPLTPEPPAVSAPLPQPEPVSPPLTVTPVPDGPTGRRERADDEFVDWVSGLSDPRDRER